MTELEHNELGRALWKIANQLRGAMTAEDLRDYMLAFLLLRHLSGNYEATAKRELGKGYPELAKEDRRTPLTVWYEHNAADIEEFEAKMRRKTHYVIKPNYLWTSIAEMARVEDIDLLNTLEAGFRFIESESFSSAFDSLFSEISLFSTSLRRGYAERNKNFCIIIKEITKALADFSIDEDAMGNTYEYLIGQFAAVSRNKSNEFYTPQRVSTLLSAIVALDNQDPYLGKKEYIGSVFDFSCGSGSLLLNVRNQLGKNGIGKIYGQELNKATCNLARMNMLLHGLKDTDFEIFHGDSLANDWGKIREANPAKIPRFDAVVSNPPFSYRWEPSEALNEDARFKNYGLAPKSAADFAFLLHGFHYLKQEGTMAIILPRGVLSRGKAEGRIRTKLLKDRHIDAVIGLPANLFFSTGIPVCVLVLKKCRECDDVLFINAAEDFERGKRQNRLTEEQIDKIVSTYQYRKGQDCYSRRVTMEEIEEKGFSLKVAKYVSTAEAEKEIDLHATSAELTKLEGKVKAAKQTHNVFLKELDLPILP